MNKEVLILIEEMNNGNRIIFYTLFQDDYIKFYSIIEGHPTSYNTNIPDKIPNYEGFEIMLNGHYQSHFFSEKEFIKHFKKYLDKDEFNDIMNEKNKIKYIRENPDCIENI